MPVAVFVVVFTVCGIIYKINIHHKMLYFSKLLFIIDIHMSVFASVLLVSELEHVGYCQSPRMLAWTDIQIQIQFKILYCPLQS